MVDVRTLLSSTSLTTILGTTVGASTFGTFTGSTIPDNSSAKAAMQALETAVELRALSAFSHSTSYSAGTIGAKLDKIVTITDAPFNAVADDATDNAAAIEAAAAELGAAGGVIHVPPGRFRFTTDINLPDNVPITIRGDGSSASELISASGASIIYTGTPAEFDGPQFFLQDIGIKTDGAETHDVVDVSFTGGSGGTGMTFGAMNVEIAAYDSGASFRSALKLNNARNLMIDNLRILGDRDAAPIVSEYGIEIIGDSDPVEILLHKVQAFFVRRSVWVHGEIEGLTMAHCAFVAVREGLRMESSGAGATEPWLDVHDCHINAGERCITTVRIAQYNIHDNLFYYQSADGTELDHASLFLSIDEAGVNLDSFIHHNGFHGIGTEPKNAIVFSAGAGVERCIVDANIIKQYDTGIWLSDASIGGVIITDTNQFSGNTDDIINAGTGNLVCIATLTNPWTKTHPDGFIEKGGSSVVTLNASGDGSFNFATAFPTAFLSGTLCNGDPATHGEKVFSINQTSCTASSLAFSVRPNPGAVAVRVNWQVTGH